MSDYTKFCEDTDKYEDRFVVTNNRYQREYTEAVLELTAYDGDEPNVRQHLQLRVSDAQYALENGEGQNGNS
ncbi:MAG: hypothetical protein WC742_15410 [Gallionellaceae bacterium]